jgi:hypothetical protein
VLVVGLSVAFVLRLPPPSSGIVLTTLGCGVCRGFLRERTGRILPGLFPYAAFVFLASQYLGRLI